MAELSDTELLQQYAHDNSEAAFEALVTRHIGLVYSAALRKTNNAHAAEEITQAVFIILARKAGQLTRHTALSGWLYQTTRLTAANHLRGEIRRVHHEQEAYMQSLSHETEAWPQIEPLLEDAMGRLNEKERNAVVLRFFEGKNFQEVGAAFGGSENAAKKRVQHGLEKLRKFFIRHGVSSSTTAIAESISTHSVQLAPAALAKSVTTLAIAKGASASVSTLILIKGALNIMTWTKTSTALAAGVILILAIGTTTAIVRHSGSHPAMATHPNSANPPLTAENRSRLNWARQWSLAIYLYSDSHHNQLPTNLDELLPSMPKQGSADEKNWELMLHGRLQGIPNLAQTVLLREKEPQPTSDGKFSRTYAFADGHAQIISSPAPDFTAVEQRSGFVIQTAN